MVGNGPNQTVQTLAATAPSVPGIPTFTDAVPGAYYDASNPLGSVLVAHFHLADNGDRSLGSGGVVPQKCSVPPSRSTTADDRIRRRTILGPL